MTKDDRELIERLRAKRIDGDLRTDGHLGRERIPDPDCILAATRLEALQAQPVGEGVIEVVTKAILFADSGSTEGWEDNVALGQAAIEAMPQEGWAVAALRDVVDPLAKLGRDAKAQGRALSGEAYRIAHDVSFIKSIAKDALAALTASPPVVEREAMGWQHAIMCPLKHEKRWIYALYPTEDDARRSGQRHDHAELHDAAFLYVTASPPVVEREAKPSHLSVIPVRGHPEKHAVFDAVMGDAIAVCPDEIAAQRVFDALTKADSTPVAQGEEVREALRTLRYIVPYLDWTIGSESPGYHPTMPSAVAEFKTALATLTKGARDAG
jgi:hypothetical protein